MTVPTQTPSGEPRRLGSAYVLTSLIGTGAQGEVWLGNRVSDPASSLAVKLLRADLLQDPGVIERFVRERATLMRVRSPYVVGVQDMVVEGTTAAIVMDYVGGGDLKLLLQSAGTMPPADVAQLGALVAEGLAAVHDAGIVHRDVKPANVLIDVPVQAPGTPAATSWTPRLADFGVARICNTVASSRATGAIGTPLYMAPEILDVHAPTPAADVYSLGIVLYEALCGVPPFVGAPTQILGQHARRAPGRPRGVPDDLWAMIERMLAKQPTTRPGAREIAQCLTTMVPGLVGLPAAPRMQAPPASTPSAVPYMWHEESSESERADSADSAVETAPTVADWHTPTMVAPSASSGAPMQASSMSASAPTTVGADEAAPSRRGRRRRVLVVTSIAAVVVVALVATGMVLWTNHRQQEALAGTIASLPGAKAKLVEAERFSSVSKYQLSPSGRALAVLSFGKGITASAEWSLYDLDSADQSAVWTGECSDDAMFWNDSTLMCEESMRGDAVTLVSMDGSTTDEVPGPADHKLVGTDGSRAILIDDDYKGPLVALDESGTEVWRSSGEYSRARVHNGFILAYETRGRSLQVLSASTGTMLYSQPMDKEPNFKTSSGDPLDPGGVSIDAGTRAFVVVGDTTTVYDAEGDEVGSVGSADSPAPGWTVSSDPKAKDIYSALQDGQGDGNTVEVVGAGSAQGISVDTSACQATRLGKEGTTYSPPEMTRGESCVITPKGLIGGDSAVLFTMGQPASSKDATGDHVIAYDLDSGEELWRTGGTFLNALPSSTNVGGGVANKPRILVKQSTSPTSIGDLAIYAVDAG